MTVVSLSEWKGEVFDVKENKMYQAKFVLQKDLKLAVSVKWGLLSFTDKWIKID